MFWGLTELYPERIVSNSDSVSAEEEVESKHLKEAIREAGLLPVPGLSTPRPRSRNILTRPAGFLPHIAASGRQTAKPKKLVLEAEGVTPPSMVFDRCNSWHLKWAGLQLGHREGGREGCPMGYQGQEWCGEVPLGFPCRRGTSPPGSHPYCPWQHVCPPWNTGPSPHSPASQWWQKLRAPQYCKVVITDVEMPVWEKVCKHLIRWGECTLACCWQLGMPQG